MADEVSHIFTQRKYYDKTERVLNIYTHPIGGLGNRIKNIISRIRLYSGCYDTVDIHWAFGGSIYNRFYDLFTLGDIFPRINEINHSVFIDNDCREDDCWCLLLTPQEQEQIRDAIPGGYIDLQYQLTPQLARAIYIPYFKALKPSEGVQRLIDKVNFPKNCIAVHIRHSEDWRVWQRWAEGDIGLFINEMKKYDGNTYFYLVCHIKEVENLMVQIFGDRIITLPDKDYDKKDNKQHVADMYLLSKPQKIILTYGSTFSECSWWLGECKQDITVIGNLDRWNKGIISAGTL